MKKFYFLAIIIIATLSNLVIAQSSACVQVIYDNDTINFDASKVGYFGPAIAIANYGTKIVHDTVFVIKHDTVYVVKNDTGLVDSLKRCLMSGKWYLFKSEKSSGPGYDDWTEYTLSPDYYTDYYDTYTSDSAFSYHNGLAYFAASYTISIYGTELIQSIGQGLKIWEVTINEFKYSYCDNNGCYRITQKHTIVSK